MIGGGKKLNFKNKRGNAKRQYNSAFNSTLSPIKEKQGKEERDE